MFGSKGHRYDERGPKDRQKLENISEAVQMLLPEPQNEASGNTRRASYTTRVTLPFNDYDADVNRQQQSHSTQRTGYKDILVAPRTSRYG